MGEAHNLDLEDKTSQIQSLHSSSRSPNHDRIDDTEKGWVKDEEMARPRDEEVADEEVNEARKEDEGKVKGQGLGLMSVISRVSMRSTAITNPGPPPDGGWRAWSQGAFNFSVCV